MFLQLIRQGRGVLRVSGGFDQKLYCLIDIKRVVFPSRHPGCKWTAVGSNDLDAITCTSG